MELELLELASFSLKVLVSIRLAAISYKNIRSRLDFKPVSAGCQGGAEELPANYFDR
jgi:hypothetical protein